MDTQFLTNNFLNKNGLSNISDKVSNPIMPASSLIAKINALSGSSQTRKQNSNFSQFTEKPSQDVNYPEFIKLFNDIVNTKTNVNDLFMACYNLFKVRLNTSFMALGILNAHSNCLNIRLVNKIGSVYSSKVFLNEESNEIIKAINSNKISVHENNLFLKTPSISLSPTIIVPIKTFGETVGVLILGDDEVDNRVELYSLVSSYLGLMIKGFELKENALQSSYIDSLTGLCSHRHFQETLSKEIKEAEEKNNCVSVVIFDVNNISKINKEFGHAKGDEIIKLIADKVSQNVKKKDTVGRYGGDEIAVILPESTTDEAKYIAEYITYTLSCTFVDGVGPIKVSVGIASYPDASCDQEKLLILAEQAVYVSKSKGFKNGNSAIVSSQDYDFWDDTALNSFASVIAKRHSQIGINFEEELVDKFQNENINSQNHLLEVVTSLASAIDAKDTYTKGHSSSVSRYAVALARAINLPENEVEKIKLGALLHDVGKIGIPENVLKKSAGLTDEEWQIMKQHPTIGATKVLQPNPLLHDLIPIVKYHHEQWNGKGYPEGLKGTDIPLAARIVAVADTYHALISDRPYRKGMSIEKACEILKMGAGIQWDADLIREFIQIAPSLATMI